MSQKMAQLQLLRQTINAMVPADGVFGDTKSGTDWCIKALHPSDPSCELIGIPDHSAVPSVMMNYQSTFTVSPPAGATTTWAFNACLLPHPIAQMYIQTGIGSGTGWLSETNLLNTQIAGTTHLEKYTSFRAMAQRWRLAYQSVSVYQDAPALSDQGTIVVCQPPVQPLMYSANCQATVAPFSAYTVGNCAAYNLEDFPDYTSSQSLPNAYFGKSKDGVYVPLKLTETCQDWVSERDQVVPSVYPVRATNGALTIPPSAGNPFPFPSGPLPVQYTTSAVFQGQSTSCMLNGTWATICARNLSLNTNYSFFVRQGLEIQVSPQSSISPQLKLSPPYDGKALDTYFRIARELKDGYPVEYNDWGTMWDVINKVARKLLPVVAPLALNAGNAMLGAGAAALKRYNKRQKAKQAPVAATEAQKLAVVRRKKTRVVNRRSGKPRVSAR